jgi:hypothetical protein
VIACWVNCGDRFVALGSVVDVDIQHRKHGCSGNFLARAGRFRGVGGVYIAWIHKLSTHYARLLGLDDSWQLAAVTPLYRGYDATMVSLTGSLDAGLLCTLVIRPSPRLDGRT